MATLTQESCFDLAHLDIVMLAGASGRVVSCTRGELWITVDGDPRDLVLLSGQQHRIDTDLAVVISALKPAIMKIEHGQSGTRFAVMRRLLEALPNLGAAKPRQPSLAG